jgi:hypothetical protein
MREPERHEASDTPDGVGRKPYSPPQIERLGSMTELTASAPVPGSTDSEYGPELAGS